MCAFFFAATLSCCSDRRKSFGPSAPIAYATSVSPPDEAVAWPGAGVGCKMRLLPGRVQVFGAGYGCRFSRCRCLVLDMAAAWPAWRCRMANYATGCPWQSSCKSPRTLQKCKLLITRQLTFGAVLGEHKLSSPSTRLKVNRLCIRCLCFGGVRGDLQEAHVYDKRLCGYASRCQFPLFPSTKSRFLCAFEV